MIFNCMDTLPTPTELPEVGIFKGLDPGVLRKLTAAGQFEVQPEKRYLAIQGEPNNVLAVIVSGKVSITAHARGESVKLAELGAGQTIGEMSILDPKAASANARVVDGPAGLWRIDSDAFEEFVNSDREAGIAVIRALARAVCHRLRVGSETMLRAAEMDRSGFFDRDY